MQTWLDGRKRASRYARTVRPSPPLALEIAAARGVAALSRRVGAGGGTTSRASSSRSSTPARSTGSRRGCRAGTALVSATNGKTTTAAMAAEILRPRLRLAHNAAGANLVSGVASTLLAGRRRRARPVRGGRGARCPRCCGACGRGRVCLGNLFRDQLDRYGELELSPSAGATASPSCRQTRARRERATTRSSAARCGARGHGRLRRSTTRASRGPSLQHAADSKYCVRCGTPYDVRRGLRRPPRRLPLPELRPRAAAARRRGARRSSCTGSSAPSFELVTPAGARRVELRAARALQRLQRARRRGARARARRVARRDRGRARALQRRVRPLRADRRRRQAAAAAPDQEPGRRERGGADARRRRRAARRRRRAERRDRRRPRRLVDLGRRLRAAARRASRRLVATRRARRRARAALQLRRPRRGRDRGRAGPRARRSTAGSR